MTGDGRDDLVRALRAVPLLAPLGGDDLRRYAGRGTELRVDRGGHLAEEGDERAWFHLLLEGRVEWTRRVAGADVHVLTHTAGTYFGHEPILLDIAVPVTGTALEPCRAFRVDTDAFWDLLASCPEVRRELLTAVTQRVRALEGVSQQQARLASLGTLAAGLAHELNNPVAAVRAGVGPLGSALAEVSAAALRLGRALPDDAALAPLAAVRSDALAALAAPAPPRSALRSADAEDAVAEWLDEHGADRAWDRAPTLVRAGLNPGRLDALTAALPAGALGDAVEWLAATLTGAEVLGEVREGATRVSDLVQAMREYTYLDQGERQDVDVRAGLESTLAVLAHRLRDGVEVVRDHDPDLPTVRASGTALNQVWTNLVDNALDAMGGRGRLTLSTRREGDRVAVAVGDTGPGVPPELVEHIFDPYFTTKGVGDGVGLGLDTVRRIVEGSGGDVRVESHPGSTRVTVRLPITPAP